MLKILLKLLPIYLLIYCNCYAYAAQTPVISHNSLAQWVQFNASLPPSAIIGGYEPGKTLYICRGTYNNEVHAGRLIGKTCKIAVTEKEISLTTFQVLTGGGLYWQRLADHTIPKNAIISSHKKDQPSYICRAKHDGCMYPGELTNNICIISYKGKVYLKSRYKILLQATPI